MKDKKSHPHLAEVVADQLSRKLDQGAVDLVGRVDLGVGGGLCTEAASLHHGEHQAGLPRAGTSGNENPPEGHLSLFVEIKDSHWPC